MINTFIDKYTHLVNSSIINNFTNNFDSNRYGYAELQNKGMLVSRKNLFLLLKRYVKNLINTLLPGYIESRNAKKYLSRNLTNLQWLYDNLNDATSRELLIKLLAYRALGYTKVKLPLSNPWYWEQLKLGKLIRKTDDMIQSSWKPLYRHDLRLLGFPFDLYLTGVVTQFLLQQYHHEVQGSVISVIPGDIVIDAGGCYGDTAFNFAHKTGDEGHVYSFEFLPENLEVFAQNLKINPNFENRISIINHAVWEYSDLDMFVEGSGPGTKVKASSNNPNALKVKTLSIDDFVNQKLLKKIDFIKMDIEGSELSALKGAERCIREFKPNLAICIYHKLEDFWEIPKWIDSLEMGYQFHLGHYTIHAEETVLYAKVSN